MRFPLTAQLVDEARRFELRSACRDCLFWRARAQACLHGWPDEGQGRWPLDAPGPDGAPPTEVAFCKEFELR
ncbi:MAG: hypothetical protein HS111_12120 [Kofleriaceae bacterium]|nr:hypothetical protein [Kofleriaceae bacterium]MCL4227478.1 hypothetical protein [Myxococcales bacterium]